MQLTFVIPPITRGADDGGHDRVERHLTKSRIRESAVGASQRTSRLLAVVEQLKRLLEGLARLDSKAHFVLLSSRPHLNARDLETG